MNELQRRLLEAAERDLPPGRYLICLGGGADSAIAAWTVASRTGPDSARGVFVNHGLAGSAVLEEAAAKVAASLGIRFDVLSAPVASGPGIEARAREARQAVLEESRHEDEWLVTGHSRDDQAETVLANFLRGAGARGLSGIPRRRGPWVRPLLGFAREELRDLATDLALPCADDPANTDPQFLRNQLRHDLIPHLERGFNPALRRVLARAARSLGDDELALDDIAAAVPVVADEGAMLLPRAVLTTLPPAVASRAVRRALRRLLDPYSGTTADVAAVLSVARGEVARNGLSEDFTVEGEGPYVALHSGAAPAIPAEASVSVPGRVIFAGRPVAIAILEAMPALRRADTCYLGAGFLQTGAKLRVARPGDRVAIRDGNKRIADALAEAAIPRRKRLTWPLLEAHAKIAAVAGVRTAAWARAAAGGPVAAVTVKRER